MMRKEEFTVMGLYLNASEMFRENNALGWFMMTEAHGPAGLLQLLQIFNPTS